MIRILLVVSILFSGYAQAQDTIFYREGKQVTRKDNPDKFIVVERIRTQPDTCHRERIFRDGILRTDSYYHNYSNVFKQKLHGPSTEFYENGQLYFSEKYYDGKLDGERIVYYDNGKLKRKEVFKLGTRVTGECYDTTGNVIPFFEFRVQAQFPGGLEKFSQYLKENVKYPKYCRDNSISGRVYVSFVVLVDGTITDVTIKRSVHAMLDEEATRVIKNMPDWSPGEMDGVKVKSRFTQPILFSLATDKKKKKKKKKSDKE